MLVETTKGPIDDSELDVERVEVDDAKVFAVDHVYRLKGTTEAVCTMRQVKIWKFDPLTEITVLVDGRPGVMRRDDLDISVVVTDTPNEYTQATEYRLKGTDTIVSRGVHVHLKRPPQEGVTAVGGFGR